jgi:hypothetical protein
MFMDFSYFQCLFRNQFGIQSRIQKISQKLDTEFRVYTKRYLSLILLLASLVLGKCAHELTQREALMSWEKSHFPSEKVVHLALMSRGMSRVQDPAKLQRILRSLPATLDESGSFWRAIDNDWITFFLPSENSYPAQVYGLLDRPIPVKWEPVGLGWKAFEEVLKILDQNPIRGRLLPEKKTNSILIDPREIVF